MYYGKWIYIERYKIYSKWASKNRQSYNTEYVWKYWNSNLIWSIVHCLESSQFISKYCKSVKDEIYIAMTKLHYLCIVQPLMNDRKCAEQFNVWYFRNYSYHVFKISDTFAIQIIKRVGFFQRSHNKSILKY